MDRKPYYITTPIYYPNSNLHIGNIYTSVIADVLKRYKILRGYDAYLTTGTDEHGQKIMHAAEKAGKEPQEFVDKIAAETKVLLKKMDIDYDSFIRSTDPVHEENVKRNFQYLYDKGDIYKGKYSGYYCESCETFFTETQLDENGNCPDCGREVSYHEEESYFFKLSKYTDKLKELYKDKPDFLEPKFRQNEMLNNFINKGLDDLSVTRNSFDWGVDVPFDNEHVVYVWIDALTCYLTAIGYGYDEDKFNRYWPAAVHLIGKDIVRFHAVIWPALLMALDMEIPKKVFAHGWILFDNDKMSKSKGNIMYPEPLVELYGVEALKFFLLREFNFGSDGNFSSKKFLERYNSDLVNDLGNLVSRTTSMITKYNDGIIKKEKVTDDIDNDLIRTAENTYEEFTSLMDDFHFNEAIEKLWSLVRRANKYVDETEPWILGREENYDRLDTVLYNLAETLRIIAQLLEPIMRNTSKLILEKLGQENQGFESAKTFGLLKDGVKVNKGENLFNRLDIEEELKKIHDKNNALIEERLGVLKEDDKKEEKKSKPEISIEDFDKLDLAVGKIVDAQNHPDADKLLVFKVDIGEDKERTIVSGIKKWYDPKDLIGKNVIVIKNLKPVKMRGILSEGMLLAAGEEDVSLLTTMKEFKAGSTVR